MSFIDVLSKYGWILPLKSKCCNEIKGARTKLFEKTKRRLVMVQIDKEIQFLNSHLQNVFKKYQINFLQDSQSKRYVQLNVLIALLKEGIIFSLFRRNKTENISTSSMKSFTGITTHIIKASK